MNNALYQHPDGYSLVLNGDVLTATDNCGKSVSLPIGPLGLVNLADKLKSVDADLSEQAGAAIATDCLDAMLAKETQAMRVMVLQGALIDLQRLPHPDRAAGGFAVVLVSVLERGLGVL